MAFSYWQTGNFAGGIFRAPANQGAQGTIRNDGWGGYGYQNYALGKFGRDDWNKWAWSGSCLKSAAASPASGVTWATTTGPDKYAQIIVTNSGRDVTQNHAGAGELAGLRTTGEAADSFSLKFTIGPSPDRITTGINNGSQSFDTYINQIPGNDDSAGVSLAGFGGNWLMCISGGNTATGVAIIPNAEIEVRGTKSGTSGTVKFFQNGVQVGSDQSVTLSHWYGHYIGHSGGPADDIINTAFPAFGASVSNSYSLTCATGTFALTGPATAVKAARLLTAPSASFVLTGNAALLNRGFRMTAAAGSFALSGQPSALIRSLRMTATAASFTLTGNAALLKRGYLLTAAFGSFTLSGQAVGLPKGFGITAVRATFALTGFAASTLAARRLSAVAASFTLTGRAVGLVRALRLPLTAASFVLTGNSATFTYGSIGHYTLPADRGSFTLTGRTAALVSAHSLAMVRGTFALTGFAVGTPAAHRLSATLASFALTASATALLRQARLAVTVGTFTLTGNPLAPRSTRRLTAGVTTFALTGLAARLVTVTLATPESRRVAGVVIDRTAAGEVTPRHIIGNLQSRRAGG